MTPGTRVMTPGLLTLRGTVVTADAMRCQRQIAQQVVAPGGDYARALKGNQGILHDDVPWFLDDPATPLASATPVSKGHGRIETRLASVSPILDQSRGRVAGMARLAGFAGRGQGYGLSSFGRAG